MRGQIWIFFIVITFFIILVDFYSYRGVNQLTQNLSARYNAIIKYSYWGITVISIGILLFLFLNRERYSFEQFFRYLTVFNGFFILFYVPKLFFIVFLLLKDIVDLIINAWTHIHPGDDSPVQQGEKISRTDFLLKVGIILSAIPFISILHGIFRGRTNFTVNRIKLSFPNLPEAFDGLKLVQISDLHIGSFGSDTSDIHQAVRIVNNLNADYVLFTGDMVNNRALEMQPFISTLKEMKSKNGNYAILGNHDYGEYYPWASEKEREENMKTLYEYFSDSGFHLLRNESVFLEKGKDRILLGGVENWGLPPFPQHGDLKQTFKNADGVDFKILMSHDPSHWDAEILDKTDVDLTLSGHTHGMQFAIKIPGWRWSPVRFKYPRWAGLYTEGERSLYVNIGLGFIAFPGRVGTPPEITEITLKSYKA